MNKANKQLQLQYHGYLQTPLLWKEATVYKLCQLELPTLQEHRFSEDHTPTLLGKLVERFVISELNRHQDITVLAENIQVNEGKQTIGEIDCLLLQSSVPIHVEIIYKFYLFDASVGTTELEHWIGPNRKDSLIKKLNKLKNKQLPLIHHPTTTALLQSLQLPNLLIQQRVIFKAQLFIPFNSSIPNTHLNKQCIIGFYIPFSQIDQLKDCKFFILKKLDWLQIPHTDVNWLTFQVLVDKVATLTQQKIAPLTWVKFNNGTIQKIFIIWWD